MTNVLHGLYERAEEAAATIRAACPEPAEVALVLGSGLGSLADALEDRVAIPYEQIPHFPRPTVEGHQGNLVSGTVGGTQILVLQGRFHHYEGHDLSVVTFPVRVLRRLGIRTLILTAATGGIDPTLKPGALLCLSDHLNLLGRNPLQGPNDKRFGVRFPDMSEVYSARLRAFALAEARSLGFPLRTGTYACLPGPCYETPAEIRMLRTLGADVVGMSTVPEAIVARHSGMDVLAFALVTNAAAGVSDSPITHDEVIESGRLATPKLLDLLFGVVGRIRAEEG